jgi:hypothetical protein
MKPLRVLLATIVLVVATMSGNPTIGPILVGLGCGLAWPDNGVRVAGASAVFAWGGLLLWGMIRGAAIGEVASKLGDVMVLPGPVLVLATLLYPAILAASAAWLGHLVSPVRRSWPVAQ